jgi:hypothetical protein
VHTLVLGAGAVGVATAHYLNLMTRFGGPGITFGGRRQTPAKLSAVLREMEATPCAAQGNHGRLTYVEPKIADIERLFGRR